ncbi:MAG TPA: YciI-like protein [Candidatus Acidoferrum sp.]|nr:YciI-like protein [Candidatus Acidoferrum sp.]
MANYYALFYDQLADDFVNRRAPFREEHLRLARASYDRGEIQLAGALADPADGALLIFCGESAAAAEEFVNNDPYVRNGLVKKWHVRKWSVVVGNR